MRKETAIRFCESMWYENRTPEEITALQLYEKRLCLPAFSILHEALEASIGRPVQTLEFGLMQDALKKEFEQKVPHAEELIRQMGKLKSKFISDCFEQELDAVKDGVYLLDIHSSPDFQCDQTGGFPVSLCACWEKGKAWLEPNESLLADRDEEEQNDCRACCADFGIRDCPDEEAFNNLLRELGEDAVQSAAIYSDDEGMVM